jgi:tryptophan synthase alpha chain
MNRIDELFARYRAEGRKALVGYMTAGDPDSERSLENLRTVLRHGVDILELGVPFSDPTADGPIIQAAALRALAAGADLTRVLALVRALRKEFSQPIVLFGYANPFFRYGYDRLCADAAAAGADGLLVVDMPFEMAGEIRGPAEARGLDMISLIAPTTGHDRAARVLEGARGFVYYIMVRGVTGARGEVAADLADRVRDLRSVTSLPIAAGFGVSNGGQAREVARAADAVVVGSALVRAAGEGRLEALTKELKTGVEAAR